MTLFSEKGFNEGRWAGQLAQLLRKQTIIPELSPKARVWRATWKQWIQFEEPGFPGPVFWLGKPGIISNEEALHVGYYVERGLPGNKRTPIPHVITPQWHWYGFLKCLDDNDLRSRMNSLLGNLPRQRSGVWIRTDLTDRYCEYEAESTLLETRHAVTDLPSDIWIDVILGVSFRKPECLTLQETIVSELSKAIICAYKISSLVKDAMLKRG